MMLTTRLPALLLVLLAAFAASSEASGQAAGPGATRGWVHPRGVALRGAPARYPAVRRALPFSVWVPGHEVERTRSVWVPGRTRHEWVPAQLETRYDACGRPYTVCVRPGRWRTVCEPGHYERRVERVWVPGRWERRR